MIATQSLRKQIFRPENLLISQVITIVGFARPRLLQRMLRSLQRLKSFRKSVNSYPNGKSNPSLLIPAMVVTC